jgi:hypothetical protein
MGVLKSRHHPIQPEVEAELEEVHERILIVRVVSRSLRALYGEVDRVEADGDFAFQMAADCAQCQAEPLAGFLSLGQ